MYVFIEMMLWFLSLLLLMRHNTLIDFWMLNQLCTPEINFPETWYIFLYATIILLRIFVPIFISGTSVQLYFLAISDFYITVILTSQNKLGDEKVAGLVTGNTREDSKMKAIFCFLVCLLVSWLCSVFEYSLIYNILIICVIFEMYVLFYLFLEKEKITMTYF